MDWPINNVVDPERGFSLFDGGVDKEMLNQPELMPFSGLGEQWNGECT
jgi:hypothetical protein